MSKEIWIDVMRSFVAPLVVGAVVAWLTAWLTAKYSRSVEIPSEKPLSRTQHFIRKIGRFIKSRWPDLLVVPATYVWPVKSFLDDLTMPSDNIRVVIMWVALDVLVLSLISAFWLSLYVPRYLTLTALRARQAEELGHKKD